MAGEKLALMFNQLSLGLSETADIVYGRVIKVNPLVIKVDNRFDIEDKLILLSEMVKKRTISYPTNQVSATYDTVDGVRVVTSITNQSVNKEVQISRDLEVGDSVRMLNLQKNQLFYVLERGSK